MSFSEQKPDLGPEKREEILDRCPLLEAFIDRTMPTSRFWFGVVDNFSKDVEEELLKPQKERWGYERKSVSEILYHELNPGPYSKRYFDDANQDILPEVRFIIKNLFLIGYEVGSKKEAFLFIPDILEKLNDLRFFKPEFSDSDEGRDTVSDYIKGIIEKGVETKKKLLEAKIKETDKEEPEEDNLDIFREFINSLDFGDED